MRGLERQVRAPQQVIVAMRRPWVTELRAIDRNTSPRQPTQKAKNHSQEGFLDDAAGERILLAIVQSDNCTFSV
ncbi:hypothetical protein D9M68_839690 [compost metagenome]